MSFLSKVVNPLGLGENGKKKKIKGEVVLMKSTVLGFNNFQSSVVDRVFEILGSGISLQLVSATHSDPAGNSYISLFPFIFTSLRHTLISFA